MPTIQYTCKQCGHEFNRVIFLEDTPGSEPCPKCRNAKVEPDRHYSRLTKGLFRFGGFAKDTN